MNFRQFALNNVKNNTRSYAAYFLSSVFSITVFFIYAALIFHPEIIASSLNEEVVSGNTKKESLRNAVIAAEIIIFAFSFLFVLYSMSAFLRSRKKEFGLLTLLGITKGQLNKMIFIENNLIGITAIATGIGVGSLFFKLFLMGVSAMLDLPDTLPFVLAPKAIFITIASFLVLFEIICIFTLITVRVNNIAELLYNIKKTKKYPTYSILLSLLAIGTIGTGYYLAYTADIFKMMIFMIPITILVTFGTYFLFTQCSIMFIKLLQKRRASYLRSTNMLTISDLAFKLKDNARVLFLVSILSAVSFTSSGVLFSLVSSINDESKTRNPQSISLSSINQEAYERTKKELINELRDENIKHKVFESKLLRAQYLFNPKNIKKPMGMSISSDSKPYLSDISLLSQRDYNIWAKLLEKDTLELKDSEAAFVSPTPDDGIIFYTEDSMDLLVENSQYPLSIQYIDKPILNSSNAISELLVVNDKFYQNIIKQHPTLLNVSFLGVHIPNWTNMNEKVINISNKITLENGVYLQSRADFVELSKGMFYIPFFIGLFISCLFFLAAASILYFRLYNDIDNDVAHYQALYRIGLSQSEMKLIITKQILILFLAPFFVAAIHASFAFKALQNMLSGSVIHSSLIVIGSFLILQLLYFFVVRALYIKKLKQAM